MDKIELIKGLIEDWRETAAELEAIDKHLGFPERAINSQEAKTYRLCANELEEFLNG